MPQTIQMSEAMRLLGYEGLAHGVRLIQRAEAEERQQGEALAQAQADAQDEGEAQ